MDKKSIIIKGIISSDAVYDAVAKVTGISHARILSDSRQWPVVEARMISILALQSLGLDDFKIASLINRGRSSACKSRHAASRLIEYSKTFRDKFNKVQIILNHQNDEK